MNTFLLLTCLAAPPEAPSVVKAEPDAKLNAAFRTTDGWIGGDGAFSVRVSDKRVLWLFSDTWAGSVRDGKRKPAGLVNNSVGVQEGRDAKVSFFIQKDRRGDQGGTRGGFHPSNEKGKPVAIFTPPDKKGWFWLFAGHFAGGKLHVFLPRFEKSGTGGAFGFKALDVWLGTVSNPMDEPTKWKITYAKMPFAEFGGKRKFAFGSSVLTVGDHTYVYGYEETPGKPLPTRKLLVARVPKEKLSDFDSWRFYSGSEWKAEATAATGLAGELGAEFSVSYLPGLKRYTLVSTANGLSARIIGRFATSPEGPWSEPVLLYTCPEMKRDKKVFTYAGKAHPHLAGENELVISYATNSFELAAVINNAELYWPTFVRVKLK